MIRKSLIEFIFEAASIERWNDHIRPSRGFTELDKQSHKMICAYVLSKLAPEIDSFLLIEGGIFEFLHRLVLTDIKPPIFHRLMEEKGTELNRWAIEQIQPDIQAVSGGFASRFERYFTDPAYAVAEKKVLEAAHYLATKWEFDIIYDMCHTYYGIDQTRREIDSKLQTLETLPCFSSYMRNNNYQGFVNLLGELRFQQRWSRSPRIPATSVIGHMLIVAVLSYFCACEISACSQRCIHAFWGGLFHDVPEVLTRDIVSPVKNSVQGLDELIKQIEQEQMDSVLYPLIPETWRQEIEYFTNDEFCDKVILNGKISFVPEGKMNTMYNQDKYFPIDGRIIRGCDHLAACIETYMSHTCGITTHALQEGNRNLCHQYRNAQINGIDFGCLFDYFRI
ncbi:HD domain-containing protein [Ructibacterium gallinarum]|uniref:HD domain-containing protein n=1 Tax=Ructibacterium gallinarum TaxID=2779355 RepID=A0A9D5LZ53_9FIRM|nr:HD domain-containing protein [Ructibacterium gallinarum]MBE5039607.1 HD domain-containing protein [Ructibacterium gallinarum]